MCPSLKTLFNFQPPATDVEICDTAVQFVRNLSGFRVPSKANEKAFGEVEAAKARLRTASRFGACG